LVRIQSTHRFFAYAVTVVSLAAAGALVASWRDYPPQVNAAFVVLVLAVAVSENFDLELGKATVSLGFPLTVAAVVLLGPTSAALVAVPVAVSVSDVRRGTPPLAILYNLSSFVLVTLAAGWAYLWTGGRILLSGAGAVPFNAADFPQVLLPLLVVIVVSVAGNVLFVSAGMVMLHSARLADLAPQVSLVVPNEVALSFVGFLIAQVLAVNLLGLLLFIAPLVVARQVYQRYLQLREAYADVVRSLIGVLEAKDPYTRGHSERVAGYALALGRALALDPTTLERLEYAALLHDIGKIAIAKAILVKPGGLSDEEYQAIKQHPLRGAEIVSRIPSLGDIVPCVRFHHEWFDGKGYCEGLAGQGIPMLARVLSIADAFDAMTTARPYRPAKTPEEAKVELSRMSGTQFDAEMVDQFVRCDAPYLYSRQQTDAASSQLEVEPNHA
jgi:HD domain